MRNSPKRHRKIAALTLFALLGFYCKEVEEDNAAAQESEENPTSVVWIPESIRDCFSQQQPILRCIRPTDFEVFSKENAPWMVTSGSDLRLRAKPSLDSKVLTNFSLGQRLTPLYRSTETVTADGKSGHWVLVSVEPGYLAHSTTHSIGWVFDAYLIGPSSFKVAKNAAEQEVAFWVGPDTRVDLEINTNGSFSACYRSKETATIEEGQIMRSGQIFWFKTKTEHPHLILPADEKGLKTEPHFSRTIDPNNDPAPLGSSCRSFLEKE